MLNSTIKIDLQIKVIAEKLEAELQTVNPSNILLEKYYLQLMKLS